MMMMMKFLALREWGAFKSGGVDGMGWMRNAEETNEKPGKLVCAFLFTFTFTLSSASFKFYGAGQDKREAQLLVPDCRDSGPQPHSFKLARSFSCLLWNLVWAYAWVKVNFSLSE